MPVTDPIAVQLGSWSASLSIGCILLRLLSSMLIATVIGWERASKRHSAGLRTFILVTIAATAGMLLDCFLYPAGATPFFFIPAALLIGTSSICVNSLLFSSKNQIRGLTTAAASGSVSPGK